MNIASILAIYFLFWVLCAFLVLPFGIKSHFETGDEILPGHADGAPANFKPKKIIFRTTILSAILFGIYYANYVYGWVTQESFNFLLLTN
ncbi:hypothetical protein LPB140_07190 [Sphingorhabdus lutea]|uniref:DUF1467 family protein n=1 Tax=Sphingorhabdus lutea TaxID=1913578 RepID=A0A1L3JC12_9SPHN|nr:DUF1467 family protein [Sphingorhabdus lutea]APG62603.1 hypothetical protein LPB140_07190 [Sphingorhabdus lutea]